jgi:carbonic anhydrase
MNHLASHFASNREWAAAQTAADPGFFDRLCHLQRPDLLWFGCSDSRVPANEIVGLAPGELLVHRDVANVVPVTDLDALATFDERWDRLCELNVAAQVHAVATSEVVETAWERGAELAIHGWIYDLEDGLIRDLEVTVGTVGADASGD